MDAVDKGKSFLKVVFLPTEFKESQLFDWQNMFICSFRVAEVRFVVTTDKTEISTTEEHVKIPC
jgi:hypothetical protein